MHVSARFSGNKSAIRVSKVKFEISKNAHVASTDISDLSINNHTTLNNVTFSNVETTTGLIPNSDVVTFDECSTNPDLYLS